MPYSTRYRSGLLALGTLSKLRRGMPGKEYSKAFAREIVRASDRAAAILAGNYLDQCLRTAMIQKILAGQDESLMEQLFRDFGVLYSLDDKIVFTYAIRIYKEKTRNNLDLVKNIRNTFAHSSYPLTFTTPEIKEACRKLT
jgi:hypothetical protein